jgi:hypothetical protein
MIGFVLRYWRFILPALAVFSLVGGFWGYGAVKYRAGYEAAQGAYKLKIEAIAREAAEKAGQDREKIANVEKNLDDAGIDRGLVELGIMRRADDR